MTRSSVAKVALFTVFFIVSQAGSFSCGADHEAWVWNCQSILDNWSLDDNTEYTDSNFSKCVTDEVGNQFIHDTVRTCNVAENDSCIVFISGTKNQGTFPPVAKGSDIKSFVQTAISKCASDDKLSAVENLDKAYLSMSTCYDANLCQM